MYFRVKLKVKARRQKLDAITTKMDYQGGYQGDGHQGGYFSRILSQKDQSFLGLSACNWNTGY